MIKKTLCSVIILGSLGFSNTNAFALAPFSTLALYAGGACVIGETYRHLVNATSYGLGEFCNSVVKGVRNLGKTASKMYYAQKPVKIKTIINELTKDWKIDEITKKKLYDAGENCIQFYKNKDELLKEKKSIENKYSLLHQIFWGYSNSKLEELREMDIKDLKKDDDLLEIEFIDAVKNKRETQKSLAQAVQKDSKAPKEVRNLAKAIINPYNKYDIIILPIQEYIAKIEEKLGTKKQKVEKVLQSPTTLRGMLQEKCSNNKANEVMEAIKASAKESN